MGRKTARLAGWGLLPLLAACGGGGAAPPAVAPPPPVVTPPPPPGSSNDTPEYRRSNAAVAAGALAAYDRGAFGRGVTVAVIDSGIALASAEFAGRIAPGSRDFAGNRDLQDPDGHGTSVTAVLGAARNGASIQGVAPDVTLFIARADAPGTCGQENGCRYGTTAIAAGIDAAVAANARAVNLSLGGEGATLSMRTAGSRAGNAGVVLVMAAGNDGNAEPDGLAREMRSIASSTSIIVGALGEDGNIATFSNRAGTAAASFLVALGERERAFDQNGTGFLYSGTSISTPVVTGAVALLAQQFPALTGGQIVDILLRTADDLGAPGADPIYGRGALNIARAILPVGGLMVARVPDPLTLGGTIAPPLGDGGAATGALARVEASDAYGRAYAVDLASTLRRAESGRLAATLLGAPVLTATAGAGRASAAFAWRGDDRGQWAGERLTGAAFARTGEPPPPPTGHIVLALAGGRTAVIGQGEAAASLIDIAGGTALRPDTLLGGDRLGLGAQPLAGGAWAQPLAGGTVSLAIGQSRLMADRQARAASASQLLVRFGRRVGALDIAATGAFIAEDGAMLGARLSPGFGLAGARTVTGGASVRLPLGAWALSGEAQIGQTRADVTGTGLIAAARGFAGTAGWLALEHGGVIAPTDRLRFSIAQPLRAAGDVALLTGGAAQWQRLGPSGREVALEAGYAAPLAGGWLDLGLFHRIQPGHIAGAPADSGGAVRFRLRR